MKKNDSKNTKFIIAEKPQAKAAPKAEPKAKKGKSKEKNATPPVANFSRTSKFVAHRSGKSEKRLSTNLPLLLYIPLIVLLLLEATRDMLMSLAANIVTAIGVEIDPVIIFVALVAIVALLILLWWAILSGKEAERCRKAEETRYYFYDDIIEFCEKDKRTSFRTIGGIVSVRVTPAIDKHFGPSFMTGLIALLSFNSKPLWQRKYGFRDVTIVTLGSPAETIVLHDVEDPKTLVSNIKLHYPQCNVESFGNGFNL